MADEIVAAGGSAIAVEGSIAEMAVGEKLTDAAVSTFGNLHSVVNNAGIIRDAMLWNMTEEEFDSVIAVHLKGTFSATRAAVRYWRDQSKAGVQETRNLVNTSSGSGLHGNYGQWNYSAAKAGLAIQQSTPLANSSDSASRPMPSLPWRAPNLSKPRPASRIWSVSPSTSQSSIATTPPTARHSWPTCRAPSARSTDRFLPSTAATWVSTALLDRRRNS